MSKELTPKMGQFDEIISIIDNARTRALKAVNAELIQMYWNVGEYLSSLCANSGFGDKVIDEVAAYIAEANPGVKGFNRRGLYRMKQFYETYKDDEFVTPLVTQISWTNHLLIMSGSKSVEERHFYMTLCAKEHYIPSANWNARWTVPTMSGICFPPRSWCRNLSRRMCAAVSLTATCLNSLIYQSSIPSATFARRSQAI